jgi:hypothetical protein
MEGITDSYAERGTLDAAQRAENLKDSTPSRVVGWQCNGLTRDDHVFEIVAKAYGAILVVTNLGATSARARRLHRRKRIVGRREVASVSGTDAVILLGSRS